MSFIMMYDNFYLITVHGTIIGDMATTYAGSPYSPIDTFLAGIEFFGIN